MSDALEHEVNIIISVVENFREAARKVDQLSESVGGLDKRGEQAAKTLHQLADAHEAGAKGARSASQASRALADMLTLEERKAGDAARQWDLYARSLSNAGRSRWSDQNATNAKNWATARPGSVFAQGQAFDGARAMSAGDTTWARDYTVKMEEARRGLAQFDRELNSNQVALKASATTFAVNARAFDEWAGGLARTRYAMYDVATTAGILTTAIAGIGVATVTTSASFESAFTNVERTMEPGAASVEAIRSQLMNLSRQIPLTFGEISQIATLGNQLGVEASAIEGFTGTVARFSAVAGVSAEETAKSFGSMGEILDVLPGQYENLGSSIALVGRRSVATEQEILSLTREIGQQAHSAGFTADQVVGLAGALGELRVPPERARGSLTTYFQTLNKAVAEGGPKLDSFAQVVGVTSAELERMVRNNEGPEIMRRFLAALSDLDNVDTSKALDDLGLAQLRVSDVFQRLSSNVTVFNDNLASGAQGWTEGTELARQYGMVLDDLESKWKIFINAVAEVGAAVGDKLAPAIKAVLDGATDLLHRFAAFADTPFGDFVIKATAGIAAFVGAMSLLVGGAALAAGSLAALRTAVIGLGFTEATRGVLGFIGGMLGMQTAAAGASTALTVFKWALVGTGIGAAVVLLGTLTGAFLSAGQAAEQSFNKYIGTTAGLAEAVAADTEAYQQAVADGNTRVADSFTLLTPEILDNAAAHDENAQAIANVNSILGTTVGAIESTTGAIDDNTMALGANTLEWVKNQLRQSEAFREFANNSELVDAWNAIGANFDEVVRIQAESGAAGVHDYFMALAEQAYASGTATIRQIQLINKGIASALNGGPGGDASIFDANTWKEDPTKTFTGVVGGLLNQLALLPPSAVQASKSLRSGFEDASGGADDLARSIGSGGGGRSGVTRQVRTLVDYANDLSSVMKRAFDFRFGNQQALDKVTSGWQKVRDAAEAARDAAAEHQRKLADLAADKQIKEYWLSIAENYGDELRAAKLRAELADLAADQAKEQKDLAKAQDKSSMTLVGNSEAAIENRASILALVGDYQDYLKSLAASGMSQKDLQAKSAQLRAEFVQQATSMGFSRAQVEKYAKAFDDMATIIQKVPRNVTVNVNANTDPAVAAIREFEAKAKSLAGKTYGGGTISMPKVANGANASKAARQALLISEAANLTTGAAISQIPYAYRKARLEEIERKLRTGNYWTGGYVGDGGKYEPKGIVHGGEFVFSKAATSFIGRQNLAYMHSMAKAGRAVAPMMSAGAGGMVEFSPYDRQLLVDIKNAVGVTIGAQTIQATTNGYNANLAQRRSA